MNTTLRFAVWGYGFGEIQAFWYQPASWYQVETFVKRLLLDFYPEAKSVMVSELDSSNVIEWERQPDGKIEQFDVV